MRKFLTVLTSVSLLIGVMSFGLKAEANFGRSYTAPKGTPVIDGEVDDVWATAKWTNVDKVHDGTRNGDSTLRIKLLWDETGLYFLGEAYDTTINRRNDLVEIYLDQLNDKTRFYGADDSQTRFYVRTVGVVSSEASGTNAQLDAESAVAKLPGDRCLVEGKIVWTHGVPKAGQEMGLEFMYHDGTEYAVKGEAYRWNVDEPSGEEQAHEATDNWGTLIFAEAGEVLPENTYVDGEVMNTNEKSDSEDKTASADDNADVAPDDAADDTNTDADANGGQNNILYIGVGIAIFAVVIIILLAGKGKKTTDEEKQ